nr:DUF664 domain-containing protein [Prescottella agglutinans]
MPNRDRGDGSVGRLPPPRAGRSDGTAPCRRCVLRSHAPLTEVRGRTSGRRGRWAVAAANNVLGGCTDLGAPLPRPQSAGPVLCSLGTYPLIEETGRHAGHIDILRTSSTARWGADFRTEGGLHSRRSPSRYGVFVELLEAGFEIFDGDHVFLLGSAFGWRFNQPLDRRSEVSTSMNSRSLASVPDCNARARRPHSSGRVAHAWEGRHKFPSGITSVS